MGDVLDRRLGWGAAIVLTTLAFGAASCRREGAPAPVGAGDAAAPAPNPLSNAYFGDLHVHTRDSFDAFLFATKATPDDAYRYARGAPLAHPSGYELRLGAPLDFYAVPDHAEYRGILPAMTDPAQAVSRLAIAQRFAHAETVAERRAAFQSLRDLLRSPEGQQALDLAVVRSAWQDMVAAAERHNEPGKFTTFIGYEYTSAPDSQNLHRNVIFRDGTAPELPFTRLDSINPEDLWRWLDQQRARGIEALAIPHNSNGSNGQMFKQSWFDGRPLDPEYAALRMRNEPLVEVTQVKGTSDTHPALSPNDELGVLEIFPYRIATNIPSDPPGGYVREAYLNGLALEHAGQGNPFRFGLIGSSDTHNAATSVDEGSFVGKIGIVDGTPAQRSSVPLAQPGPNGEKYASDYYRLWSASGLAGVWAEENTRQSIYHAFRRKETFATTGPRIRVRFFGGYDYGDDLAGDPDMIHLAYQGGVPMGGDLTARGEAPRFLVWAARDPKSAPLQRLQVIKGWVEGGAAQERIYDVACSDGLAPDATSHRCPDNSARVDLATCKHAENAGAAELKALWRDPAFRAEQRAFYYLRVLENPTCRWSTWDAVNAGAERNPDLPATIQERAWSSPIWVAPALP